MYFYKTKHSIHEARKDVDFMLTFRSLQEKLFVLPWCSWCLSVGIVVLESGIVCVNS